MNAIKFNTIIIAITTMLFSTITFAVSVPPFIQTGEYHLPDTLGNCFYPSGDSPSVEIVFQKPFPSVPVVTVSQVLPIPQYGDTYFVILNVTKTGFTLQRRTIYMVQYVTKLAQ